MKDGILNLLNAYLHCVDYLPPELEDAIQSIAKEHNLYLCFNNQSIIEIGSVEHIKVMNQIKVEQEVVKLESPRERERINKMKLIKVEDLL